MNAKRWTLLAAALSTVATVLLAVGGILPPAWAALVGAVGAGCYALTRAFQKRAAGATWKSLRSTTEAWGAGLAIVAPIVIALAGVLPPKYAATAAGIAAVLLKVARSLQATLPEGPKAPEPWIRQSDDCYPHGSVRDKLPEDEGAAK